MDRIETMLNENLRLIDVAQYERLSQQGEFDGERVELIRGRVVRMAAMGPLHGWAIQRLTMMLTESFGKVADVRVQLPLYVSDDTMPQPDFILVPKAPEPVGHPKKAYLVIEVAQSSLRFDRVVKAPLYAGGPAKEYWVVDLQARALEVYRKPKHGAYTERFRLHRDDAIAPLAFPKIEVALREFLPKKSR